MHAFWDVGYGGTSITDLTAATGMHPGALYGSFGDKKGLFLAALRRYSHSGLERVRQLLSGSPSPLAGLRDYLLDQAAMSWSPDGSRGCLMANSALELLPGDAAVTEVIRQNFVGLHRCIADAVAAAQDAGEVTGRWPAEDIASQFLTLVEGMFVLGRTAQAPDRLAAVVNLTLDSLRPPGDRNERSPA
jgi:TetR/AcrR family transcriptional repressor of nem operon